VVATPRLLFGQNPDVMTQPIEWVRIGSLPGRPRKRGSAPRAAREALLDFVPLCEPANELYLSRNVVFCYLGRDLRVRFSQCSFSRTCSG